jgi:A/G-specific adenine glycosylase
MMSGRESRRTPRRDRAPAWTHGLTGWYRRHGRHDLPWRLTRDPWAVLVSEVMLQQTSVGRVLPRWRRFLDRWPDPPACAAAPLDDVLREWDGLGYPRRARALWAASACVAATGWPRDEAGLRALPGVGVYTARALLAFALDPAAAAPPRDVNLGRVAARAAFGSEPDAATATDLDRALSAGRPPRMPMREYAFALFDVGALLCRARSVECAHCPLTECASRSRLTDAGTRAGIGGARRQSRYPGSMRQLRGAVLRALLDADPPATVAELADRLCDVPAASRPGELAQALVGLAEDGLVAERWRPVAAEPVAVSEP